MTALGSPTHGVTAPGFRPDIQGMRALAVLIVVLYHIDLVPGGYVGVDVFFVISGFLMGGLLLLEADSSGRVSLQNFFTRRSRRLLPALAVTVLATLLMSFFIVQARGSFRTANQTATGASLFGANLRLFQLSGDYFAPSAERNPLLHTWSLSVEEQFYFAVPLLVAVAYLLVGKRRPLARRALIVVIAGAGVLSLGLNIAFTNRGANVAGISRPQDFAFFGPFTRVWEFAAGILLAAWTLRLRSNTTRSGAPTNQGVYTVVAFAGVGTIIAATVIFDDTTAFPGYAAIVPVIGTVLLLASAPHATGLRAVLSSRPAVVTGDLSYGWYLWHWPLIVFCRALWGDGTVGLIAAALVSLVVAALSYRFIEERFRRDQRIVGRRAVALGVCCIIIPVAVSLIGTRIAARAESRLNTAYDLRGKVPPNNPPDPGQLLVTLVGDSHARELSPALVELLGERGISAVTRVEPGCELLIGVSHDPEKCTSWQQSTLRALLTDRPDIVVIASYTAGRTTGIHSGIRWESRLRDPTGRRARTETEALEIYRVGLTAAVDQLTGAGIEVIIVSSVPDFWTTPFDHVSTFDVLVGRDAPHNEQRPITEIRQRNGGILAVEQAIAAENPNLHIIDPVPILCSTVCQQVDNGTVLYRDTDHVSQAGATRLAQAVLTQIRAITTVKP